MEWLIALLAFALGAVIGVVGITVFFLRHANRRIQLEEEAREEGESKMRGALAGDPNMFFQTVRLSYIYRPENPLTYPEARRFAVHVNSCISDELSQGVCSFRPMDPRCEYPDGDERTGLGEMQVELSVHDPIEKVSAREDKHAKD